MEKGEEFQEEDVWSVLREKETSGPEMKMSNISNLFSSSSSSSSSNARYIPKGNEVTGEKQSSAPMNVPNWSKIYGKKTTTRNHTHSRATRGNDDDDEEEEEDSMVLPPHELIARRLARTQISSFSMCEGIRRTGFLESNVTPPTP
ncbi:unnamed protein product [Cochlearia groenlandica]